MYNIKHNVIAFYGKNFPVYNQVYKIDCSKTAKIKIVAQL